MTMINHNQNPEQKARDKIDEKLRQAGWVIQDKNKIDFEQSLGILIQPKSELCLL